MKIATESWNTTSLTVNLIMYDFKSSTSKTKEREKKVYTKERSVSVHELFNLI